MNECLRNFFRDGHIDSCRIHTGNYPPIDFTHKMASGQTPFSRLKLDWLTCAWSRLKDDECILSMKWPKIHGQGKVFEIRSVKVTLHFVRAHAHLKVILLRNTPDSLKSLKISTIMTQTKDFHHEWYDISPIIRINFKF